MRPVLANDNKLRDGYGLDPDRKEAEAELSRLCEGFSQQGFSRDVIASAMLDQMFKMLEGNPFRTGEDAGVIWADQHYLWRIKHRVVKQPSKGTLDRRAKGTPVTAEV